MNRRFFIWLFLILPLGVGLLWLIGRHGATSMVVSSFGNQLSRLSDGKFTDLPRFVELRLDDAALLGVEICLAALASIIGASLINRLVPLRYHWVGGVACAFVFLNVAALACAHTALFWCVLYCGKNQTHNYTQYEIKNLLLRDQSSAAHVLLMGNSQTRAQIDPAQLNKRLSPKLWATELHFPGNHPYEVDLNFDKLSIKHPAYVVCYLTEGYFYSGVDSEGLRYFQDWGDLPKFHHLWENSPPLCEHFLIGLFGDTVPLYRLSEPLAGRLFGSHLSGLAQEKYNNALATSLEERAIRAAATYSIGPAAGFEKRALVELAKMCRDAGTRLVLCEGQMNPIFGHALNPVMRRDMLMFLNQLAIDYPNVVLLDQKDLPPQSPDDYEDLTHCNLAAKTRFSEYLATVLDHLVHKSTMAVN